MTKHMIKLLHQKQAESKRKVHVAVNYTSIKTKQLKKLNYEPLFLELDHILTLNMHVSCQSIMAIIKAFGEYKTQGYQREVCHMTSNARMMHRRSVGHLNVSAIKSCYMNNHNVFSNIKTNKY